MVYKAWAYTENEEMKSKSNWIAYRELDEKYKINRNGDTSTNLDDYDIVVGLVNRSYGNESYEIYKNAPNLSLDELALICDEGNLCFGYRYDGNIVIYID